jgi:5'-phosphate synthase pdxT subunit
MLPSAALEVKVGILALQGAFSEHQASLQRLSLKEKLVVIQVRTASDLARCDALIIPGGESTTIALLARLAGLLEPLRQFVKRKPVWGTCAGAILLAKSVEGAKKGGQELLGGMSITIGRNGWGSQVESFEAELQVDGLRDPQRTFPGIFIRAPVILSIKAEVYGPPTEVVARIPMTFLPEKQTVIGRDYDATDAEDAKTVVALRQGLHFLTTFHPELTKDDRFHEYFVRECVLPRLT